MQAVIAAETAVRKSFHQRFSDLCTLELHTGLPHATNPKKSHLQANTNSRSDHTMLPQQHHCEAMPDEHPTNTIAELRNHLHAEQMLSEQARRLAGKSSFTTTHLFGRVGRSALRAPYDKAYSFQDQRPHKNSHYRPLRNTITLPARPGQYPSNQHQKRQSFTQMHSSQLGTNNSETVISRTKMKYQTSPLTSPTAGRRLCSGPTDYIPTVIHGAAPRKTLQHLTSNRAYIYFLEA